MKVNEIQSFATVADAGSVQEAARRLGLTQSAVSRLIQRLEDDIGTELFDRSTKPFRLTRAGESALAHSRRVLRALDDFSSDFSGSAEPSGPFRIGISPALSAFAVKGAVECIRQAYPELAVSITSGWSNALVDDVRTGDLEAAIIVFEASHPLTDDLLSMQLTSEPVHIIAPRDIDPAALASIETMNAFGWALLPQRCRYRAELQRVLESSPDPLNVVVEAHGQELLLSLVAGGVGLGLAPASMLGEGPYRDAVRVVDIPAFRLDVSFWLVRGRYPGRLASAMETLEASLSRLVSPEHSKAS